MASRLRSMSSSGRSRISSQGGMPARAASREAAPGRRENSAAGTGRRGSSSFTGEPRSAAPQRPDSAGQGPQFWRAKEGAVLQCGPLGREVAQVDPGIVVAEETHFYDYFGGLWVATTASDNSVLWFNPRETGEDGSALWEFVVEQGDGGSSSAGLPPRPTGGAASKSNPSHDAPRPSPPRSRSANSNPFTYQFQNFNSDAKLYGEYYESLQQCQPLGTTATGTPTTTTGAAGEPSRDWNDEYQCIIEHLVHGSREHEPQIPTSEVRGKLEALAADFVDEVDSVVTTIVKEMSTPNSKRQVPSHRCSNNAVGVYFKNGVMYRICLDTAGGAYGGDTNASKVASTVHKTHELISSYAPLHGLSCPMIVVMTFGGHRFLASTIPPIQRSNDSVVVGPRGDITVTGSATGNPVGGTRAYECPVVRRMIDALGEQLNLKQHELGGGGMMASSRFPAETTVHAGMDGRLYILNTGRALPPLAPPPQHPTNTTAQASAPYFPQTTSLFRRLRPEASIALTTPCNPDAFVPDASNFQDNSDVQRFTQWLRDDTIPVVAATLGFLEPLPSDAPEETPFDEMPSNNKRICISCKEVISDDTFRFLACRCDEVANLDGEEDGQRSTTSTEGCPGCFLCPQCLINIRHGEGAADPGSSSTPSDDDPDSKIAQLLRCNPSKCRPLNGLVMQPDVTTLFHSHGLNMRFLSYVHAAIPHSAKSCTARYLETEMIARAAKHLLNSALRRSQDEEETQTVCINFFLALLQPDGELAEQFWSEQLGPLIQTHFEVFSAFDTSDLDMELCYRRVAQLTGVELTEASVRSFKTEEPFVQLKKPHPVMKWMHLPRLTEDDLPGGPGRPLQTLYKDELVEFWKERRVQSEEGGPVLWDGVRLSPFLTKM